MVLVELLTKKDCSLCEKAKEIILFAQKLHPFHFRELDITQDPRLYQRYQEEIPVIRIDGEDAFKYRVNQRAFIKKVLKAEKK